MKKTYFAFLLTLFSVAPLFSSAAIMLPKSVSIGDLTSYDAGTTVQMNFVESTKPTNQKNNVEYGVARAIKSGEFLTFEILTTETKNLTGLQSLSSFGIVIPNLVEKKDADTYVAYIKFFEKSNPDNESFYFTKEFDIAVNNTPFIQVKNINLLQSNGKRFATQEGPSIYAPSDAAQFPAEKLATSTSIEVTFVSNQEAVITPKVQFSKIRSDVFSEEYTVPEIVIKKGTTYAVIPMPVFDYAPGVYMGKLSFGNPNLKNTIDFQYIVSGDSVSVGTVSVVQGQDADSLTFEIFGTPLDLERYNASSSTSTANFYAVTTELINEGRTIYSETQQIDFNEQSYSVKIPKKIKAIDEVRIIVTSPGSNAIVYEANKDFMYKNDSGIKLSLVIYIILYVLLTVLTIVSLFKGKIKVAIVLGVLLIGLFFARQVFSEYDLESYSSSSQETYFKTEKTGAIPKMILQEDVPNTVYECGENIQLTFKINYLRCSNTTALLDIGFSRISLDDAYIKRTRIAQSLSSETYLNSINGHAFYSAVSPFISRSIPSVPESESKLYINVDHSIGTSVRSGYNKYIVPIRNTCDLVDSTCSCAGRTQTCTKGGTVVSTTPNSPTCALQASCSISRTGTTATFNTIVTNAIGAVTYKNADTGETITNPNQRDVAVGATIVQRVLVTDTDGMTATATCTVTNDGSGGTGTTTTGGPTGTTTSTTTPRSPTITRFIPQDLVVPKNRSCKYSWNVEDVDRCTLFVNNTSILLQGNGLTGPADVSAADGLNQRAVLTCVAEDLPADKGTISTTTLCQVLPEVIEN